MTKQIGRTFREKGSAYTDLVRLIRTIGENTDVEVRIGTVTSVPPSLKIKVDGLSREIDDLIVAEHLTEHKRKVSLSGGSVSGSVSPSGSLTSITLNNAEMTVQSALNIGDRVLCLAYQTKYGTEYIVLDKAVIYSAD